MAPTGTVVGVEVRSEEEVFRDVANFENVVSSEVPVLCGGYTEFGERPRMLPSVDSQLRRRLGVAVGRESRTYETLDREMVVSGRSGSVVYRTDTFAVTGFALAGLTPGMLEGLLERGRLAEVYEGAFRMLFAFAVAGEMGGVGKVVGVDREVVVKGFRVNALWARGTQGGLAGVVLGVVLLVGVVRRRKCELGGEPGSVVGAMKLLAKSPEVCVEMVGAEFCGPEEMKGVFKRRGGRYKLELGQGGPSVKVSGSKTVELPLADQESPEPWVEKLWAMRVVSGVGFIGFFGIIVSLLVAAFAYARGHNGELVWRVLGALLTMKVFQCSPR